MYKFDEENLKNLNDAFNLLNQIEVKGLQNINILGNIAGSLQKFFSLVEKVEDDADVTNTKEVIKNK